MKNNLRGLALLIYSFVVIFLSTAFAATLGDIFIALGFAGGIYIAINTGHIFNYKSLEEQFQEDTMKPNYTSSSNDTFYKNNNQPNNNNQPIEESVVDFTECSFVDEYSEPENFDEEYEDESMSRFSDSSDKYYQSIVNSNKDMLEEE